jgi:hypothetical protein
VEVVSYKALLDDGSEKIVVNYLFFPTENVLLYKDNTGFGAVNSNTTDDRCFLEQARHIAEGRLEGRIINSAPDYEFVDIKRFSIDKDFGTILLGTAKAYALTERHLEFGIDKILENNK